jgi:hypothetical protein
MLTLDYTYRQLPALVPLPQGQPVFGLSRSGTYRAAAAGLITLRKVGSRTYIVTETALAYIAALPEMKPRGAMKDVT